MNYCISGSAGFIACNLADHLLKHGNQVIGYDNFTTGKNVFLQTALNNPNFKFIEGDILDFHNLKKNQ